MNQKNPIQEIANAVLYEGFLLYPYRLSSVKNKHRWSFGVLCPEPYGCSHGERESAQAECLVQAGPHGAVDVNVRFLQVGGDSPVEREVHACDLGLRELCRCPREIRFSLGGIAGKLEMKANKLRPGIFVLTTIIANMGRYFGEDREAALARSLVSAHAILSARDARFISLTDVPGEFAADAARCKNDGLWPALVGPGDSHVLAAPIILPDYPKVAAKSPGDLFDNTEIDEILTLRVRTLTDGEKEEVRAGDGRGRALLERSESLTREEMAGLHAAMHRERIEFKKGDRVRLRPRRRADIFDVALAGKLATVVSVERDFEDNVHLCVTVDDDPGKDLGAEGKPGHRFFFSTDEVEVV